MTDGEAMRFIGPRRAMTEIEIDAWMRDTLAQQEKGWSRWAVGWGDADVFAGMVGARPENDHLDFGIYLRRRFRGTGLAARALRAAVAELQSRSVDFRIFVAEENLRSRSLFAHVCATTSEPMEKDGEKGCWYQLRRPIAESGSE
jgi:RimJ/RimL family protein N-acetyltransferase